MTIRQTLSMIVLSLCAACATEASGPTREDCQRLRDHVADLAVAQAAGLSAEEREKQRANLAATGGDEYVATCMKERSEKYVECALAADTTEALGRCGR
jgi:hypothetical protein